MGSSSVTEMSPRGSTQSHLVGDLPKVARSAAMQEVVGRLSVAIRETGGVLVTGEPGAGHDTIARAIHLSSDADINSSGDRLLLKAILRHGSHRPFVALDR